MSERILVSRQTVSELRPIPGADAIETAVILGWTVVVKKGEFAVGDTAIFFEIDSFLPATDARFAFLEKTKRTWRGADGYRLKTIKLRKQLSQGLALPAREFPELDGVEDLAAKLGVVKWEEDEDSPSLAGNVLRTFPSFIPRTDQERIQNVYKEIDPTADYEVTVKLDGTSCTVYLHGFHVGVCSRNQELKLDDPVNDSNLYVKTAREKRLQDIVVYWATQGREFALQGEIAGPGIQKNRANLPEVGFYLFDIYDIAAKRYLNPIERRTIVEATREVFQLLHVPVWSLGPAPELATFDTALGNANGPGITDEIREGLVYKRIDGEGSFKIISNEYLFKHGL